MLPATAVGVTPWDAATSGGAVASTDLRQSKNMTIRCWTAVS
jgi:hypothetical protein